MAEDKKGSALSLSSSLKDDDRFLIITPDNSTGTGYDNRILKWATIKSQIESIATQKAEDAIVIAGACAIIRCYNKKSVIII